jgi:hypothetical protein
MKEHQKSSASWWKAGVSETSLSETELFLLTGAFVSEAALTGARLTAAIGDNQ